MNLFQDSRIDIQRDAYELQMSFKWFSPTAIFLAFFCVAWDGFLIFWYAMGSQTDAPWIFFVFPLIHVAVGVGLTYYTLCLFFNKTQVRVNRDQVEVLHAPIPWWRGNKNVASAELEQLYVKEKRSTSKNGSSNYTYKLRAKLVDGKDLALLDIGRGDSEIMQRIETEIESFLGIEDEAIAGEFQKDRKVRQPVTPKARSTAPLANPHHLQLQHLKAGDFVDYERQSYQVAHLSQYDWNNGDSDKLLQLLSNSNEERLVYLQQNGGLFQPYLETKLSLIEANSIFFLKASPPEQLTYQNQTFQLSQYLKGQLFRTGQKQPFPAEQWSYHSADQQQSLRVVDNDSLTSMYLGQKELPGSFENLLTP
ncbi:MAG: DUF4178 domain-containing protein [Bacteroidota bacterium]